MSQALQDMRYPPHVVALAMANQVLPFGAPLPFGTPAPPHLGAPQHLRPCPACGHFDHQHVNSRLCPGNSKNYW